MRHAGTPVELYYTDDVPAVMRKLAARLSREGRHHHVVPCVYGGMAVVGSGLTPVLLVPMHRAPWSALLN